ncbi:unnamed protein product [Merluccius merluccius]
MMKTKVLHLFSILYTRCGPSPLSLDLIGPPRRWGRGQSVPLGRPVLTSKMGGQDLVQHLVQDLVQHLVQDLVQDLVQHLVQDLVQDLVQHLVQHLHAALADDPVRLTEIGRPPQRLWRKGLLRLTSIQNPLTGPWTRLRVRQRAIGPVVTFDPTGSQAGVLGKRELRGDSEVMMEERQRAEQQRCHGIPERQASPSVVPTPGC